MRGFEIPGAWIDEVHSIEPLPPKERVDFRTIYEQPASSSLVQDVLDAVALEVARIRATLPVGFDVYVQTAEARFDQVDENTYSMTYEIRPTIRPAEA